MKPTENAVVRPITPFRRDPGSASERATRAAFLAVLFLGAVPLPAQIVVDTFAGGKIRSGVAAQDVSFAQITGMTWDGSGNLVFCEQRANIIRRIRADGIVETVAGNGATGSSGDGGPALNAALNHPASPHFDAKGNLYFADVFNRRIRRIDTHGVITSVAGNGIVFEPGMDLEGPALARSLSFINDIAVDRDGNVYLTESNNDTIRRVTTAGRIEIFAGVPHPDCPSCSDGDGGPARLANFAGPGLLAFDGLGNLYVGESANFIRTIRRIAPDGTVTKFAGYGVTPDNVGDDEGKPALNARFAELSALAADAAGNVYLIQQPTLDPRSNIRGARIRRIDTNGVITTLAGGQSANFLSSPDGPALPSAVKPFTLAADRLGNVAFAEPLNSNFFSGGVVREVTPQATLKTLGGGNPKPTPDGTPARDAWFLNPVAIAFNRAGDLYIAELDVCLIRKIGADGVLATAAGTGQCSPDAAPFHAGTTQDLAPPSSIAVDSQNLLYMIDTFANAYVITPDKKITPVSFPPSLGPGHEIAIDSKDRVYLLGAFSLLRVSPDGKAQAIVSPPAQPGVPPPGFGPTSLTAIGVDASHNVYFTGNYLGVLTDYVFRVNDDGTFSQFYGNPSNPLSLRNATSLAFDSNGSVWLTAGVLNVANASGMWIVGRQDSGFSGDGGPAQSARFNATAIAAAPNGDLYIIDNNRIRKLTGSRPAPAPVIASGGIVNAVSYAASALAPGELVSIFGSDFGTTGLQVNAPENNRLPLVLGRTKVLFNGFAGAIVAATPNQINVFVPYLVTPGSPVNVAVQVDAAASDPVSMPVANAVPGLATADQSGSGQGAILNQDTSINSSANPAPRGSIVSFFGTGEGLIFPQLFPGELSVSTPFSVITEPVTVTIGGQPAEVTYAGAAPFEPIGVFQINARIPAAAALGSAPVIVSIGGISTSKPVTVAVR